jgi:hypothetical protein
MNSPSVVVLLVSALIVGVGILVIIFLTRRSGKAFLDKSKYQSDWLGIEQSVIADEPASAQLAVIKADKLVDRALKERGYTGETMGERMKSANDTFSDKDSLWRAHKLRNKLVHEDVEISVKLVQRVLPCYKRALKDLGAI